MKHFFSLSLVTLLLAACGSATSTQTPPAEIADAPDSQIETTLIVTTSFYPLTHFTTQVGGDLIEVQQVAAQGADPHSFEPTASQISQIYESDLFIFNGQGQDTYAERLHTELIKNGTNVLVATELVERMPYEREEHEHSDHEEDHNDHEDEHEDEEHHDEHDDEDEHEEDDHDEHNHGEWDPHVWLDPLRAEEIVQTIAQELSSMRPALANQFQANADAYVAELRTLHKDMSAGLSNCTLDAVIVSHDAYRYLANRYNFYTFEIAGLSPSSTPSPARLAELTDIAATEGIEHVFFETQVSPALSETLAQEIGATTLVLHSIEALTDEERDNNETYVSIQRMNLNNLRTALKCNE